MGLKLSIRALMRYLSTNPTPWLEQQEHPLCSVDLLEIKYDGFYCSTRTRIFFYHHHGQEP